MNKQKPGGIGWCDYTWSPIKIRVFGDPFTPFFRPERLSQPAKVKKPSRIFVCSMADLFGDWIPVAWIETVLRVAHDCPHHTFQFLTKNPKRYQEFNPWPANAWLGFTMTKQEDDLHLPAFLKADAAVRFISFEPLLGPVELPWVFCSHVMVDGKPQYLGPPPISWAIIGAQTGPGAVKPHPGWVKDLSDQCRFADVPLFLKDNLNWPTKVQEWPA